MFTGIVEEVGTLVVREDRSDSAVLRIRAQRVLEDVALGDSISVSGVCLTVTDVEDGVWGTDVMAETLRRSSLGKAEAGGRVNLERAVTPHTRLGGHLVQGHVDGVGTIRFAAPDLEVQVPTHLTRYMVEKGSVTVDGVSLTIAAIGGGAVEIALVPHTLAATTLGRLRAGDEVNVEADVVAKHVARLVGERGDDA